MTIIDQEINTLDGCVGSSGQLWEFTRYRSFESQNWFFWFSLSLSVAADRFFAALRLRAQFLFSSRKGAETQRNCGALGLTSGGLGFFARSILFFLLAKHTLAVRAKRPARWGGCKEIVSPSLRLCGFVSYLFFLLAKTQSRKEIVVHLSSPAADPYN